MTEKGMNRTALYIEVEKKRFSDFSSTCAMRPCFLPSFIILGHQEEPYGF